MGKTNVTARPITIPRSSGVLKNSDIHACDNEDKSVSVEVPFRSFGTTHDEYRSNSARAEKQEECDHLRSESLRPYLRALLVEISKRYRCWCNDGTHYQYDDSDEQGHLQVEESARDQRRLAR
jgi:hypothetical protein